MRDTIYTFTALAVAGTMILTALNYTNGQTTLQTKQTNETMIATISATTFAEENKNTKRTIIDVRTPEEYEESHIAGAININSTDPLFKTKLESLKKDASYSIYCRSGNRSGKTLQLMKSMGFTDVLDLSGGIIAWQQYGETLCTNC